MRTAAASAFVVAVGVSVIVIAVVWGITALVASL